MDGGMDRGMDRGMERISILEPPECSVCGCVPCSVSELGFQDELTKACSLCHPSQSQTHRPQSGVYTLHEGEDHICLGSVFTGVT